jgi:hypothetical protein
MFRKSWLERLKERGPLGKSSRRWENNIKMDLKEIGLEGVDRIDVAQDRDWWQAPMNTILNLWVP